MADQMPYDVRERCYALRVRSKKGELPSPGDLKFLEECWHRWPDEYAAMGRQVFVDTAPFGARLPDTTPASPDGS